MPAPRTRATVAHVQKAKGPAEAATSPDHGSTKPLEGTAMNKPINTTRSLAPATEEPHDKARRLAEELSVALDEAFQGRFGAEIYPAHRAHAGVPAVGFFNIRSQWFARHRGLRAQRYLRRLATMPAEDRARHYSKRLSRLSHLVADPMFELVTRYMDANRRLNESDIFDDDAVDTFCEEQIDPIRDEIIQLAPIATTKAGALAALRLAERQYREGDGEMANPLMVAVMGFLEAEQVPA